MNGDKTEDKTRKLTWV